MLSMGRLIGFLIGLAVLYLLGRVGGAIGRRNRADRRPIGFRVMREVGVLAASVALLLCFVVVGLVWHRPMLSLAGTHPDDAVVDFHSHTNVSHDVRDTWMRGFGREANRRWHARAGFDAGFVTDHNVISRESRIASRESRANLELPKRSCVRASRSVPGGPTSFSWAQGSSRFLRCTTRSRAPRRPQRTSTYP